MPQPRTPDARLFARLARIGGLAVVGLAGLGTVAFLLVPFAARTFVRGIEALAAGCIWLATSISSGMSAWTMVGTAWRTMASGLSTPAASAMLWGLVLVGLLALYLLQRLFGSTESGRMGQEGE